jgi:hypothetical protein
MNRLKITLDQVRNKFKYYLLPSLLSSLLFTIPDSVYLLIFLIFPICLHTGCRSALLYLN